LAVRTLILELGLGPRCQKGSAEDFAGSKLDGTVPVTNFEIILIAQAGWHQETRIQEFVAVGVGKRLDRAVSHQNVSASLAAAMQRKEVANVLKEQTVPNRPRRVGNCLALQFSCQLSAQCGTIPS